MAVVHPFAGLFLGDRRRTRVEEHAESEGAGDPTLYSMELDAIGAAFPGVPLVSRVLAARQSAAAIATALDMDEGGFSWESIDQAGREIAHLLEVQDDGIPTDVVGVWPAWPAFREVDFGGLGSATAGEPVEEPWGQADA